MGDGGSFFNDSMSMRDPSQQKRKKARAQVNITGEFTLDGSDSLQPCTITDIGTGGLSFISKSTLYEGDKIKVHFKLGSLKMELDTAITRTIGKTAGAQFQAISTEQLEQIQDYIHKAFFDKDKSKIDKNRR